MISTCVGYVGINRNSVSCVCGWSGYAYELDGTPREEWPQAEWRTTHWLTPLPDGNYRVEKA